MILETRMLAKRRRRLSDRSLCLMHLRPDMQHLRLKQTDHHLADDLLADLLDSITESVNS